MARNIVVFGAGPRLPVDACTGAHGSGDLAQESGKFGIAVEANAVGQPNTLIERGLVVLPVPTALTPGTKIYAAGTPIAAGTTIQAAPSRSVNVASNLTATATGNTLIGTLVTASYPEGLSTVAKIELAPQ